MKVKPSTAQHSTVRDRSSSTQQRCASRPWTTCASTTRLVLRITVASTCKHGSCRWRLPVDIQRNNLMRRIVCRHIRSTCTKVCRSSLPAHANSSCRSLKPAEALPLP
jgi:hypothetical protein